MIERDAQLGKASQIDLRNRTIEPKGVGVGEEVLFAIASDFGRNRSNTSSFK